MIRELASRIPAQNAVIRPTGPAPITVTSRTPSSPTIRSGLLPFPLISSDGSVNPRALAIQGVECALHGQRDAREDRRLRLRVGARLGSPELLHEVQELAGIVGVERHDEFLIVEAERGRGVYLDRGVTAAGLDVAPHDPHAFFLVQPIAVAPLRHG